MSGEQDRGGAKPANNPFFDESDAPQPRRARRAKPPPGIITAGGVDMARAHASGIQVREGVAAESTLDEPRVVVAVETDPRKVPTHRSLLEGRDDEDARAALLPGAGGHPRPRMRAATAGAVVQKVAPAPSAPAPAAAAAPQIDPDAETLKRDRHQLPAWMRVATVLVLLLLVAGLVRRVRLAAAPEQAAVTMATLPVPPPVQTAAPAVTTRPTPPPRESAATPRPVVTAPAPASTAATEPEQKPAAHPVKAPAPAKPTYTPPFQLPGEKD